MRVTVSMFGLELDVTFGVPTPVEGEPGLDLGYTAGSFVGFAAHVTPEDAPLPQRTPAWDEPE
jgi:hypothetical protein